MIIEPSGDHNHKYLKLVKATNGNGNAFTASYITLSLIRKIITSHLTFTNSNAEIEQIIKNIKQIWIATKVGNFQRYETDNVNGDTVLWENYFSKLTQRTLKALKKSNRTLSLPNASITDNEYSYFREQNTLDGWCIAVSKK